VSWVILAVAGGHLYASRGIWHSESGCVDLLWTARQYLILKSKHLDVSVRCVDLPNASRFVIQSSDEFDLFPYEAPDNNIVR
jgi:hypothetical protein